MLSFNRYLPEIHSIPVTPLTVILTTAINDLLVFVYDLYAFCWDHLHFTARNHLTFSFFLFGGGYLFSFVWKNVLLHASYVFKYSYTMRMFRCKAVTRIKDNFYRYVDQTVCAHSLVPAKRCKCSHWYTPTRNLWYWHSVEEAYSF